MCNTQNSLLPVELSHWSQSVQTDMHLGINCLQRFVCAVEGDVSGVLQWHGEGKRILFSR